MTEEQLSVLRPVQVEHADQKARCFEITDKFLDCI